MASFRNFVAIAALVVIATGQNNNKYTVPIGYEDKLHWFFDQSTETIELELVVKAPKTAFIALGFSDRGEAEQADLIVIWSDVDGTIHITDSWTDEMGMIHVREPQNVVTLQIWQRGDSYVVRMARKFDTCDKHDYVIDDGTTHLLFAKASRGIQHIEGISFKELKPTKTLVQLIKAQVRPPPLPDDVKIMDIVNENVKVPPKTTTYWCALRKLPVSEKHHIIRYEKVVPRESANLVHHMEVFRCEIPADSEMEPYDEICASEWLPAKLESCRSVLVAWAMGAQAFSYPENAGVAIGEEGQSPYVLLQVHFNNPSHQTGHVDNSGIRIYYSNNLREHDVGIMEIGLQYIDTTAIPPKQPRFDLKGYCTDECTYTALPSDGIRVFAAQLHAHLTGRRLYAKHIRGSVELPEISRDDHYDPEFQEIRLLQQEVLVAPGDSLIMVCEDSTADKNQTTVGGYAISDEMCISYLHYYPRVDLEVCKSAIDPTSLYKYFRYMKSKFGDSTSQRKGATDNYRSIDWNDQKATQLSMLYDMAPLSVQCNKSDGTRFPGSWDQRPIPQILIPYPKEQREC